MMGTNMNCRCACRCTVIALIAAAVLGVIGVFLQFAGLIVVTPSLTGAAFIVAVVYLLVLAAALSLREEGADYRCLCSAIRVVFAGAAGTVLVSALLLITGIAGGVFGSVLFGLLAFFFALLIGGTICLGLKVNDCEL